MNDKIQIGYFKNGVKSAASELMNQILEWTAGTGARGGVVGLSGGIDSTTVAYLCKLAFDKHNLENQDKPPLNLLGLLMPSNANNPEDVKDGERIAKALGINYKIVPIQPIADAYVSSIPEVLHERFHIGNLYAEIRSIILSRHAAANNLRIMGTGNHDEDYVLGYFTKRGDGAVDNNILGNLPKHLVREMAAFLGVPVDLINRIPTAGLWAGQTDEEELGYTYAQAHLIHRGYVEGKTSDQIQKITGFDMKIIIDVENRRKNSEHKRQLPPTGKVELEYR